MFRQHARVAGAYRVTFAPEAWKEIGRLSSGTFLVLQQALEQLAHQDKPTSSEEASCTHLTFTIRSLVIHCERDERTHTLTLHRLTSLSDDKGGGGPR
ncbi:hypothetical protein [Hyalangium rubrum]|uniref:Uncharacterized protein n=1 Tax=Hyalangium rubrum TaxID=3103134 RepID=A0ABU5GYS2_9BACT|nr:hypothetical protein [Hyalangium sp. s54d21]MDY7226352.1 hypothetical protein [Hyalangium sp. s54d21]